MPTDVEIVAAVLARPQADPAEIAAALGLSVAKYLARRHEPVVSAMVHAELNRLTFGPAHRRAAQEVSRSLDTLIGVRDNPLSSGRDRCTAAKTVVAIAVELDDRQQHLDLTCRLALLTAGIDNRTPAGPSVAEILAEPLPPVPPVEHPAADKIAPDIAARLLTMTGTETP